MSVPVFSGGWWYVTSTEEGSSYPIHRRGPTADDGDERGPARRERRGRRSRLLRRRRVRRLARPHARGMVVRHRRRRALHAAHPRPGDRRGSRRPHRRRVQRRHRLVARRALPVLRDRRRAGAALPGVATRGRCGTGGRRRHADLRGGRRAVLRRHRTRPESDDCVVIQSASKTSSEMQFLSTDDPTGDADPRRSAARRRRVLGRPLGRPVRHAHQPRRRGLPASSIAPTAATRPTPAEWTELVAHEPGRRITGVEPFAEHLVIHEWAEAQTPPPDHVPRRLASASLDLGDAAARRRAGRRTRSGAPRCSDSGTQSTTVPPTLYDEDVRTGERTLLKQVPTPNVDLGRYRSTRVWADAPDGMQVPVDIVHHVDTPLDGTAPSVVYGYGGVRGIDAAVVLRRPVVAARPWLSCGRSCIRAAAASSAGSGTSTASSTRKRNTFTDTIACVEHLVADRGDRARPGRASAAASAGGLLVGACITMRPDLFASAVAEVPFVDVVSTMSDPTLPLTITEWEEWGDPRERTVRVDTSSSYSPYDNTVPADYPAIYATAGLNDPRVSVPRAGQVGRPAPIGEHERSPDPVAHRDGRRPRRSDRPLRRLARRGPHPRLHPRRDVIRSNLSRSA